MMQRRCFPSARFHHRGKGDLAGDGQPVLGVVRRRLGVHGGVRAEIGEPQGLAVALEPVAQDVERALEVQFLGQAVEHGRRGLVPEQRLQRRPFGRLAVLQEAGDILGEEGEGLVIGARVALLVAARAGQAGLDGGFKCGFVMSRHQLSLAKS